MESSWEDGTEKRPMCGRSQPSRYGISPANAHVIRVCGPRMGVCPVMVLYGDGKQAKSEGKVVQLKPD